jgi:hypothetical protein
MPKANKVIARYSNFFKGSDDFFTPLFDPGQWRVLAVRTGLAIAVQSHRTPCS